MHVRCTFCRHSFNLSRDYVVDAVEKAAEKRHKFHGVECLNCRKVIKVAVMQMKRYVPRPQEDEEGEQQGTT
jgi:hypothetical protein